MSLLFLCVNKPYRCPTDCPMLFIGCGLNVQKLLKKFLLFDGSYWFYSSGKLRFVNWKIQHFIMLSFTGLSSVITPLLGVLDSTVLSTLPFLKSDPRLRASPLIYFDIGDANCVWNCGLGLFYFLVEKITKHVASNDDIQINLHKFQNQLSSNEKPLFSLFNST